MSIIPLYEYTTVCLSILLSDGHLKFLFGDIMSKAAVNTCMQVFVRMYFFISPRKFLGGGWLGFISGVCLPFEETVKIFSEVVVKFYTIMCRVW